jgi:spore maturation protein CgeB
MEVAFFGSSLVSSYWNGAATYYRGIVRAMHARGHHVRFFEPDAYGRQQHRDMDDPPWAEVIVYPGDQPAAALEMVERARTADLVVKASGVGVYDALLEEAVLSLSGPGRFVAFWDVDAPATLERLHGDPADPFAALVPRYDLVLTYGGGAPVVDAYTRLGARRCEPVYNALDPYSHHPVPPDARYRADLAFLGNRLPDREARVDHFFFDVARRLPARRFLLGGSGWHDARLPSNVRDIGHVSTNDHNAFNCTPLALLNISRESMARFGFSPATRVFEAAGAGACLITDAWRGLEQFLEPGREVLVAQDAQEVAAHLEALSPARARVIGERALQRVLAEHTYAQRALQLDALLGAARSERVGVAA